MHRDFADAILFEGSWGMLQALCAARELRLLRSERPFLRAVPGGFLATDGPGETLCDAAGHARYEFHKHMPGIRIGFRTED